jgi:Protein of unknown function (DUF2628).
VLTKQELARLAILRNWESYYRDRWGRHEAGAHGLDWNWAPAIFGTFWFLHRKLPLAAFVSFFPVGFIYALAKLQFGYEGFYGAFVSIRVLEGIFGNRILFWSISSTIGKLESRAADDGEASRKMALRHQTLWDTRLP